MKAKKIFEWISWVFLSVLMYAFGMGFIFTAPLTILVAPFPFLMLTKRIGEKEASFGSLLGTLLVYIISSPVSAIMYCLLFGITGLMFGILSQRMKGGAEFIASCVSASIFTKILLMVIFTKAAGFNPFVLTGDGISQIMSGMTSGLESAGLSVSKSAVSGYAEALSEAISLLMPSMLILFSFSDTMCTYGAASLSLGRLQTAPLPKLPPFGTWRFPKNIFWALMAALITDLAAKALPDERIFLVLSANLMEVLRTVFMIQGLSLMWYFMSKHKVNKFAKVLLTAFGIVFSPVSYILSMVGIFDIWYDLRKRLRRKN